MNKKQLIINLTANLTSFFVSAGISFFLTPFITEAMGEEAYGFISLGNNFVNYMTVVTIAINTMASRFIAVNWYEKKTDKASRYYSSVLAANVVLTTILAFPAIIVTLFLEHFVQISEDLISDVKLLWMLMFSTFFISILSTVFSVAPFVKNRLELAAERDILQKVIRAVIILVMFGLLHPCVWYYGLAVFLAGMYCALANISLKRKLMPELTFRRGDVSLLCVKELLHSGVWSSLSYLSSILIEGLDLLVANLFISASSMGVLSIAKTVPAAVNTMISSVQSIFVPELTKSYAKKDEGLLDKVYVAIKIVSIFSLAPISVMVVLGKAFFSLWVPSQNREVLYFLSLLAFGNLFITSAVSPLFSVFVITNNVRFYSICRIAQGITGLAVEIAILKMLPSYALNATDAPFGLYTIAGVSSVLGIAFALTVVPLYAAHCLKRKSETFYPSIIRATFATIVTCTAGTFAFRYVRIESWIMLTICAVACAVAAVVFGTLLILNRNERANAAEKLCSAVQKMKRRI